jgi:acetamidase/formamidase
MSLLGDRNEVAQVSQVHACNTVNVLIPLHPYIGQLGQAIPSSGLQDDTSVVDIRRQPTCSI